MTPTMFIDWHSWGLCVTAWPVHRRTDPLGKHRELVFQIGPVHFGLRQVVHQPHDDPLAGMPEPVGRLIAELQAQQSATDKKFDSVFGTLGDIRWRLNEKSG